MAFPPGEVLAPKGLFVLNLNAFIPPSIPRYTQHELLPKTEAAANGQTQATLHTRTYTES